VGLVGVEDGVVDGLLVGVVEGVEEGCEDDWLPVDCKQRISHLERVMFTRLTLEPYRGGPGIG